MLSVFTYRELIRNLVLKDLKLKYRDSVFGFLWSLANPLFLILVYAFVFGHILRAGPPNFGFFLMVGILPWNFFAQTMMMSTGSILDNSGLIRKVAVPMEVFPIATVLFNGAQYLLALIVFFPMALILFKISLAWSWIFFIPILLLQVLFTLGLSFILSAATIFYRDVRHFTEILLTLLFWLTPVVYDLQTVPESLKTILYMNPFSYFILAYQDVLFHGRFPASGKLLAIVSLPVLSLAIGYVFFMFSKVRFSEEA